MLISSSGRRDDCMSIDRSDWPSMKKRQSFICLPQLFGYSGHVLQHFKPKLRGRLSDATLSKLMNHVAESETMSESDIDTVIDALRGYFEN